MSVPAVAARCNAAVGRPWRHSLIPNGRDSAVRTGGQVKRERANANKVLMSKGDETKAGVREPLPCYCVRAIIYSLHCRCQNLDWVGRVHDPFCTVRMKIVLCSNGHS